MNRAAIRRALFFDALYQVLDNRVFRILAFLTLLLLLVPWLLGLREEEVVLAWGWRTYEYRDLLQAVSPLIPDVQGSDQQRAIAGLVELLVTNLAGTFGLFFVLAATCFFVPQMLEKGAADPLFSKPVSRLRLLLARYVAGILFVALLSLILMGGITLGLLANSRYFDPSLLWSGLSVVYRFSIHSAFATLMGVWTRSSTAVLLLTLSFMGLNTLIHNVWIWNRWQEQRDLLESVRPELDGASAEEEPARQDVDVFLEVLGTSVSVLHHALPKLQDADPIARSLRQQFEPTPFLAEVWFESRPRQTDETKRRSFSPRPVRLGLRRDGDLEWRTSGELHVARFGPEGQTKLRVYGREVLVRRVGDGLEIELEGQPAEILPPPPPGQEGPGMQRPDLWYEAQLGWGAAWPFNLWYSLGSSLAFVALTLGYAWRRLARINF
jgi:ABC-type transport system involved in multi-copper enzyme maturation permease subunit